jgi:dihydroflavonol-4-reductase
LDECAAWNLGGHKIAYVTTKREAERLALAASSSHFEVVVANPGCVIGPGDLTGSEFGVICDRFWRGRIPIHFGGGNNFVDVRDVAAGLRLCAERGRPGERYILGGSNRSMTAFFSELSKASGRLAPRIRLPNPVGTVIAQLRRIQDRDGRRAKLTPAQAALQSYFFYFDTAKARRELGFAVRPFHESLADAFADWQSRRQVA